MISHTSSNGLWNTPHSPLIAVPNFSFGPDQTALNAVTAAFQAANVVVLDQTSDFDHQRTVFTIAGTPATLPIALVNGLSAAGDLIDLSLNSGTHPRVGLLDVAPIVFQTREQTGRAILTALTTANLLAANGVPVYLYDLLAAGRTRAELRSGGLQGLQTRWQSGQQTPDFLPVSLGQLNTSVGVSLVSARKPLLAFNLELAGGIDLTAAKRIAQSVREVDGGLPGVRALAMELSNPNGLAKLNKPILQISCNLEQIEKTNAAQILDAVNKLHPVVCCELIGLAPKIAFAGFPQDMKVRNLRFLEDSVISAGLA